MGLAPGFDRGDKRNAGVDADELVAPGGGGALLRRVTYTDAGGTTYKYFTTEMTLPAWVIALLFKQRLDLEKVYDEVKNKMGERKSWGSGETAKEMHANFICPAHNLMVLMEDGIEKTEGISNTAERERRSEREGEGRGAGASYVATALQRFTVRSVKFVHWLGNFLYCETSWATALARLAKIYSTT